MTLYEKTDVLGLVLVAIANWNRPRRLSVGAVFMAGEFLFICGFGEIESPLAYYFLAGLCSMMPLAALEFFRVSRLVHDMQILCGVGALLNVVGYFLWLTYQPPVLYNVAMWCLLVVELARLMLRTPDDERTLAMDTWRGLFRRVPALDQIPPQQNEAQT